jgi:hypothetical protein
MAPPQHRLAQRQDLKPGQSGPPADIDRSFTPDVGWEMRRQDDSTTAEHDVPNETLTSRRPDPDRSLLAFPKRPLLRSAGNPVDSTVDWVG